MISFSLPSWPIHQERKNVPNEKRTSSDSQAETIKVFNRLTLQSTINDSADYHSDKNDAESDPKSDQVVATQISDGKERKVTYTDTTKGKISHKLLINRIIPEIITVVILLVNQTTANRVAASGGNLHAVCTVLLKDIVTYTARSAARVFTDPLVVNWKDTSRTIPRDRNTSGIPPRATTSVRIITGPLVSPTRMGIQDIGSPRWFISPQEVMNAKPLNASINGISSKHREPAPNRSKVIGSTKIPKCMDLGLSSVYKTDELGSVLLPTTRIGSPTHGYNWLPCGHFISEAT